MIHQQQPQSLMSPTTSNGMNGVNGSLGLTNASNSSLGSSATNGVGGGASNKPRLTPIEVRAVHYVMRILHKNGRMLLQTIPGLISRAPDQVRILSIQFNYSIFIFQIILNHLKKIYSIINSR